MTSPTSTSVAVGRRAFIGGSLSVFAVTAVGCSTERSPAGAAANDGIFTVNVDGVIEQYYRNWNPYTPASNVGSASSYFYEPLLRFDRFHQYEPNPWLAEKWEWNSDFDELTFTLRPDVTWTDGEPFTADDVVFSLTAFSRYSGTKLVVTDLGVKKATKIDDHTVKVTMSSPGLSALTTVGAAYIYPEHILTKQNLEKWTNPSPVGTGPWKLSKFTPQQFTLVPNPDYWGGALDQFKELRFATYANEDAGKAMLVQGKMDMGIMSLQNAEATFISKGEGNRYETYARGNCEAILFNCAKAPFDDVHIRRAVTKAIDFEKVMSLYDIGLSLANVSGLPEEVWGDAVAPEFQGQRVAQDLDAATSELEASGYSVEDGVLVKDGKRYPVTLVTVGDWTNWVTWADGIRQQLQDGLGLDISIVKLPYSQAYERLSKGDFDIGMYFAGGGLELAKYFNIGTASLHKDLVLPLGDESTANVMRWSNDEASDLLDQMAASTDQSEIISLCQDLQRIYVDQVPYYAYDVAAWFVEMNGSKWTGLPPKESSPNYTPAPNSGPDATLMYKALKPA